MPRSYSSIFFKLCGLFFILLTVFFFFFLTLGTGLFNFLWAWSTLDLHFLILGHQVVSIMCEKCYCTLLRSFKQNINIYLLIMEVCYLFAGLHLLIPLAFVQEPLKKAFLFLPVEESETEQL